MEKIRINMAMKNGIRNLLIYAIIFSTLFSSLFLSGISAEYEEYISGKTDLFLYLQTDISGRGAYEETQLFLNLNDSLKKNSFERSDISQKEYEVYKTASDESFSSIMMPKDYAKAVIHALNGKSDDGELDELFDSYCYDYKTGEMRFQIGPLGIELHSDSSFVDLYPGLKLIDGRQFTLEETENGENVCLIRDNVAQIIKAASGYSVKEIEPGDIVYLTKRVYNADYSASEDFMFELKVVGIVETTSAKVDNTNLVFIPEETMERVLRDHGFTEVYKDRTKTDINWDFGLVNIYKLSSLSQLEKLKKQIDKYKSDNWIYYTSLDKYGYSGMADLVLSISKSFRIVSYALVVLILIVSAALIVLDINSRRNEIGLLKSMGKEDREIIRDNSIVHILVYLISAAIGYLVSVKLSRVVMEYQFSNGGTDGTKLLNIADKLLKLNNSGIILAVMFIIILCIESVILYRYLISRVTVKELLEKQE